MHPYFIQRLEYLIPNAKIRLEQQGRGAEETNLGFVPLLHIGAEQRINDKLGFIFDLEGLAGGPGRAFDGALKLRYYPSRLWGLSFGYRTVEGGADVTSVYNFAWIHYGLVSVFYKF
uniref:Alginate export domain-containing protein n=1 Tax=candidate division WOR-3 bacterium TaxID=2052148 RepID=A0A7V0Z3K1_UNCW3